jgi:hypothetical protein
MAPEVLRPGQVVTATVTTDTPLDAASVRLEWGYDNVYRWADEVDGDTDTGTDTDTERSPASWVCVTRVDVPLTTNEFAGTTSTFTVPSWAPGSSKQIARWSCRVAIGCGGRDVDAHGDFTVVIGIDDVDPVEALEAPMERVSGDAETVVEIALPATVFRAGATVSGHVTLLTVSDLPAVDVAVSWQRQCESHPLLRQPAQSQALYGPIIHLGRGIALTSGAPITLPFDVALPEDASPTADAVHSSLSWFVGARVVYTGLDEHAAEQVRRPIIVANA